MKYSKPCHICHIYICIYTHRHTHRPTHTYIYMHIYAYLLPDFASRNGFKGLSQGVTSCACLRIFLLLLLLAQQCLYARDKQWREGGAHVWEGGAGAGGALVKRRHLWGDGYAFRSLSWVSLHMYSGCFCGALFICAGHICGSVFMCSGLLCGSLCIFSGFSSGFVWMFPGLLLWVSFQIFRFILWVACDQSIKAERKNTHLIHSGCFCRALFICADHICGSVFMCSGLICGSHFTYSGFFYESRVNHR